MPFLGSMLNKVIGTDTVDSVYAQRKEAYKELLNLDKCEELLEKDKKDLEVLLKSGFLNEEDKNLIAKDFWENTQEIKNKRNKIVRTIAEELKNKDPFNTRK
jgi:predicted RNA-binding protein with PUA domain